MSLSLDELLIDPNGRGLLVGRTRSGKSTLAVAMLDHLIEQNPQLQVLLVDTKPAFKATHDETGWSAARFYKAIRQAAIIPYSVRLGEGTTDKKGLSEAFRKARLWTPHNRGTVVIAQTDKREYYPWLNYLIESHYENSNKKHDSLIYVDEMLAFLRGRPSLQTGCIRAICAGGQRGVGFLGGTQRPRHIPIEAKDQLDKLYLFAIDNDDDMDNLRDMGLPRRFYAPRQNHYFRYYDKLGNKQAFLKLDAESVKRYGN